MIVSGDRDGDPARRYLGDARAIAKDDQLDESVRGPVVCTLIRDAIEFTCHEVVRIRDYRAGRPIADTEAELENATSLNAALRLALLSGTRRSDDFPEALRRLDPAAPRVIAIANRGVHGAPTGAAVETLINDADRIIGKLRRP